MKNLQQKSPWLGYMVRMLSNQKAQGAVIRNVHTPTTIRATALFRWCAQGVFLFVVSPFIILFATPVNAFPLIARQRTEGTWTYSYVEFSTFQDRARILFFLVLLLALVAELYLVFQ